MTEAIGIFLMLLVIGLIIAMPLVLVSEIKSKHSELQELENLNTRAKHYLESYKED